MASVKRGRSLATSPESEASLSAKQTKQASLLQLCVVECPVAALWMTLEAQLDLTLRVCSGDRSPEISHQLIN